jgi:hypothetical protein
MLNDHVEMGIPDFSWEAKTYNTIIMTQEHLIWWHTILCKPSIYTTCALGCGLETMIPSFLYITSPLNVVECATSSFLWKTFTTQYAYIGILSFYLCDLRSFLNNSQNYNNLHRVLIALTACLLGMHWQRVRCIKYDLFNKWQTLHSLQKCKWWVSYVL